MVTMTKAAFLKYLGKVEFDEAGMRNFDKIVLGKNELQEVTTWNADCGSVFDDFVQENIRQALLVFMSGLYVSVTKEGIDLIERDDETVMSFPWQDIVGFDEDIELYHFRAWAVEPLAAMRKVVYDRLKQLLEKEKEEEGE